MRSGSRIVLLFLCRLCLAAYLLLLPVVAILHQFPVSGVAGADKVAHALAFFLLGLLADLAVPGRRFDWENFLSLLLVGIGIEILQFYTCYRTASLADLVADAIGLGIYFMIRPRVRKILRD